jgi:TPR repeat protein
MMRAHNAAVDLVVAMYLVVRCFAAPADAAPMDEAAAALRRGDYAAALKLIRPLAEQGNALAQFNLGVSYDQGWGVQPDAGEALKWYRLAADQGYSLAQQNLGDIYSSGRGVPQDFAQALKWYGLAADQGNAFAQNGLGLMYENGQGVPQDIVRAHMWFNLSGSQGHERGLKNRERVRASITNVQLAEAQKLARGWKPAGK